MLFTFGLGACDTPPKSAESAGKKIDQALDDAGKKIDQTLNDAGKNMDQTFSDASKHIGVAAGKVGDQASEQGVKSGMAINDAEITAKIKASIFAEPGLKTLQINVATADGVVTLSGAIDSLPGKDRAAVLAGAVTGVKTVDNQIGRASCRERV